MKNLFARLEFPFFMNMRARWFFLSSADFFVLWDEIFLIMPSEYLMKTE